MPQLASFPLEFVKAVFDRFGIYLLEAFEDGQMRWGDKPPTDRYAGISAMANPYGLGLDMFTIRSIVNRLGKDDKLSEIEREIEKYFEIQK